MLIAIIKFIKKMSKSTKLFAGFVGVVLSLTLMAGVGIQTASASALTSAQVSAIISLLQSFGADQTTINNVQASLTGIGTVTPPSSTGTTGTGSYTFTRDLKVGDTGTDVMNLQKVLNMDADTQVASGSSAGAPGHETSSFGPATKAAVVKFQNKYASEILTPLGLSAGTGYVGASTRAKLGTIGGGVVVTPPTTGGGTTPTPSGTGLTVSDPGQPGASLAPEGASRVPFTKIRLTAGNDGPVTVNSITVQRTGLAQDAAFAGVVLIDENGMQIGDAKTFNSNHQATVGSAIVIPAGTSKVLTLAGNMAADESAYAGQVASLTVVSVNTDGAVVSGMLPITGVGQTINASLSIGTATTIVSSFDPNGSNSKEIGVTGYKFSGFRVTAGSAEKVRLWSVRWYQSGSAAMGDLANVQTYVDGTAYPTTVSSDGKYYSTIFPGGILLDKGLSKDIYVQGDIVGSNASGRTIQFDVYKNTDLYLTGETYGYGITPTASSPVVAATATHAATYFVTSDGTSSGSAGTPWFSSSKVTVTGGAVTTITKSSAVPAQNIAINVANQPLGGFETNFRGEPITVTGMTFTATLSGGTLASGKLITNVSLVDQNGAVVAGPVDATFTDTTHQSIAFTDTITFPVGTQTYTLKGQLPSVTTNGTQIVVSTTPSGWTNPTGAVTGTSVSLSSYSTAIAMNTMTAKGLAMTVSLSSTPAAQTIVPGGTRTFANIQLDASQAGEDMRLSSLKLDVTYAGLSNSTDLTNCQILDQSGNTLNTGSNVVNPTGATTTSPYPYTFMFDNSLIVPKQTVTTLALKCNVSGSAAAGASYAWGTVNTNIQTATFTGVVSGQSLTGTDISASTVVGQAQLVGTPSLAVTTDASSPGYTIVAANTSSQVVGVLQFKATNEDVNLTDIGLKLTNTASSSSSDLTNVTIWDGSTQVGSAVFTGSNTSATSTLTSAVTLTKDTNKALTIKADLGPISNSSAVTTSGHLLAIDYQGAKGTGASSGSTVWATGSSAVAGARIMKSYPTVSADTIASNGVAADGKLMRFKVTASQSGQIGLGRVELTLATTSANVTNINVYGFTDSGYSQAISGLNTGGQFLTTSKCASGCDANGPTLAFYPQTTAGATTTVQIPAGATYYFEVRGTVTGLSTTYSVSTTLNGDNAYPILGASSHMGTMLNAVTASTVDTGTLNSFIWSPNSTTTSATSDKDWTNGYGLQGLGASGLTQTRTN